MATSPNYGWLEPDNTDLVKNGALAIRTLGNAIDTTMATMIPKSIVDAKGDLIAATAADTPARLPVSGDYGFLQALSSEATGLKWNNDAWTAYTPTVTLQTGTIASYTSSGRYIRIGKTIIMTAKVNLGIVTAGGGYLAVSLPVNARAASLDNGSGLENTLAGFQTIFCVGSNVSQAWAWKYDFTTLGVTGQGFQFAMTYEGV